MMRFKEFVQQSNQVQKLSVPQGESSSEEIRDIDKTLSKLPKSHAALVKGFQWKFHAGNTLNGDDEHIGYVDDGSKEIAVAAPWNYGREFTILHEVGHKVWEKYISPFPDLQELWFKIVTNTKHKQNQEPEELFCMAYANFYAKNKIVIHNHPEWNKFIAGLPQ